MTRLHAALAAVSTLTDARANRSELARRFELEGAEAGAFAGIGQAALERYAGSLVAKRRAEFERVVPLTLRLCPDLGERYARWLERHPASPSDHALAPGEAEALRALTPLWCELESDERLVPYAADVLAFEVLRACARRDGELREHRSRYALSLIVPELERGIALTSAPERTEIHRFRFERARVTSVSPATKAEVREHYVGAGIGCRRRYERELLELGVGERPALLEIMPDHYFSRPEMLDELAARYPVVFHDVGLSIGTLERTDTVLQARLRRLRELAQRAKPLAFSDHLAFTRSARIDLGHLGPLWYTRAVLACVIDAIRFVEDALGLPLVLENIAAPFVIPGAELEEPEFFGALAQATGAELLLDVSNLLVNAKNFGFDAATVLARYPLERVAFVHLAGGREQRGFSVDSHDAPVSDGSFELLRQALGRARPRAIIVERDEHLPPLAELLAEARRADELARASGAMT